MRALSRPRAFDRKRYSELRRRFTTRATRAWSRASAAHLCPPGGLSGVLIHRILVCRPNHRLGNLLLLTPLLDEIARLLPDARVDIVAAGNDARRVFGTFGNVDTVHMLSRRVVRHPLGTIRTVLRIRRTRYDLAIDPCEASQSSRLLLRAARARHALGVLQQDLFPDHHSKDPLQRMPRHMAQLPVWLLRRALAPESHEDASACPPLSLRLSNAELALAHATLARLLGDAALQGHRPVIGLFADATGQKKYPRAWWKRYIAVLTTACPACVLVEILPPDGRPRLALQLPTFAASDPRAVAALIACMRAFVCADCGVMHLASASGTPTLGLFSITEIARYRPYGHGSIAINTSSKTADDVARLTQAWLAGIATGAAAPTARKAVTRPGADACEAHAVSADLWNMGATS